MGQPAEIAVGEAIRAGPDSADALGRPRAVGAGPACPPNGQASDGSPSSTRTMYSFGDRARPPGQSAACVPQFKGPVGRPGCNHRPPPRDATPSDGQRQTRSENRTAGLPQGTPNL